MTRYKMLTISGKWVEGELVLSKEAEKEIEEVKAKIKLPKGVKEFRC